MIIINLQSEKESRFTRLNAKILQDRAVSAVPQLLRISPSILLFFHMHYLTTNLDKVSTTKCLFVWSICLLYHRISYLHLYNVAASR